MKKVLFAALLAVLSMGCAITNYPVITDARGADSGAVMFGQYDHAYIKYYQVATLWDDGSDELFTIVSQDWTGDQWLKTYNNYDPTGLINFLDQGIFQPGYCDPTHDESICALVTAWNPDLPDAYPHGSENAGYDNVDDPFDYVYDPSCSGARSIYYVLSLGSRYYGECGSALWRSQDRAHEFSLLDRVTFRGKSVYHVPIDSTVASFNVNGTEMPIYGRFNLYLDGRGRLIRPITPNYRYQWQALDRIIQRDGSFLDVNVTYGSLTTNFKVNVHGIQNALDRL